MEQTNIARCSHVNSHRLCSHGPAPCIFIFLSSAKNGAVKPVTDLSPSSDYQAYFISQDADISRSFELTEMPTNADQCGFWEVDQHLVPGLYGLQIPSFLRCSGYTYIRLTFVSATPLVLQIHGVNYDPYDSFALGLRTWMRINCNDNLTGGLRKSMPAIMRPLLAEAQGKQG